MVEDHTALPDSRTELIRVLIVDDSPETVRALQKLLSLEDGMQVVATARDGAEGVQQARQLAPDIVLMDVHMPVLDGIQATETLVQEMPGSPVIMMSVQGDREYLRGAMKSGASEFLIKPFSGDELIASIHRVYRLEQQKRALLVASAWPAAAPTPVAPLPGDGRRPDVEQARLILLYSAKGGVGKSLIATNLAVALARRTKARVAMVDLDLQFGDVGMLLGINSSHGIVDLAQHLEHIDHEFIREIMVEGPSGLKVLQAPTRPEYADLVTIDHVRRILREVRGMFDYVVVDSNDNLDDINIELLEMADQVVVVTSGSMLAIKDTKLTLQILESLHIPPDRVLLALNNPDAFSEFSAESVEANLHFPISVQIPYDAKTVIRSVNHGEPVVISHPEAKISQRIEDLAARLMASIRGERAA
jgi:pilus assembly protein CpaE